VLALFALSRFVGRRTEALFALSGFVGRRTEALSRQTGKTTVTVIPATMAGAMPTQTSSGSASVETAIVPERSPVSPLEASTSTLHLHGNASSAQPVLEVKTSTDANAPATTGSSASSTTMDLEKLATHAPAEEWKPETKEWIIMISLSIISLMVALDATILVTVLPVSCSC
jgi:hypothetical protein